MNPGRVLARAVALALLISAWPGGAPALQAQAPAEARMERAGELARLVSPHDLLLAGNLAGWEAAVTRSLALNPGVAKLELEYPGIGKAALRVTFWGAMAMGLTAGIGALLGTAI